MATSPSVKTPNAPADRDSLPVPALPINLLRTYEDHVLGKFYADWTFSRASDALRRYKGRDRARGLAFLLKRFAQRSGFDGVRLSPGVVKTALEAPSEEIHTRGWESLGRDGLQTALTPQYEMLIAAAARTAEVLGTEDISQLERGTALKPEGEQLAERQVLRGRHPGGESTAPSPPTPSARAWKYPRASSTRTPIPSADSPRSRRAAASRVCCTPNSPTWRSTNDPICSTSSSCATNCCITRAMRTSSCAGGGPSSSCSTPIWIRRASRTGDWSFERGVLLLALLHTMVRKLLEWLSADALAFHFLFVLEGDGDPLAAERDLLASLLMEPIAAGAVHLAKVQESEVAGLCANSAGAVSVTRC